MKHSFLRSDYMLKLLSETYIDLVEMRSIDIFKRQSVSTVA